MSTTADDKISYSPHREQSTAAPAQMPEEPQVFTMTVDTYNCADGIKDNRIKHVTTEYVVKASYDALCSYAVSLQARLDAALEDVQAYRGALGHSVSGEHNGRLSDGTIPICGLCEANHGRAVQAEARLAEAEKDAERLRQQLACAHDFEYNADVTGPQPFNRCRKCGLSKSL